MQVHTHTLTHIQSLATPAPAPAALLSPVVCESLPQALRRGQTEEREKRAQTRNGAKANATATTRPLALPLSLSLSASCRKYSRDLKRLRRRRRRRQRWLLFFYRQVACLVFCFGSTHSPICTYKQTYVRVCVVKGKSFCFCFPCSRRSRHCDQSGKICYMRFYRTSSLYSLPFVEGEPPVRLSVCVSQCVYTCVLFI